MRWPRTSGDRFTRSLAALPHMRGQGRGAHRQHLVDRRPDRVPHLVPYSASKFALDGPLGRPARRAGARQHPRHHRVSGADAHRLACECDVQGPAARRSIAWFAISDSLPLASIDAESRGAADPGRVPARRCRAGDHRAGEAGHSRADAGARTLCPGDVLHQRPAPAADGHRRRSAQARSRERVRVGAVEADGPNISRSCGE